MAKGRGKSKSKSGGSEPRAKKTRHDQQQIDQQQENQQSRQDQRQQSRQNQQKRKPQQHQQDQQYQPDKNSEAGGRKLVVSFPSEMVDSSGEGVVPSVAVLEDGYDAAKVFAREMVDGHTGMPVAETFLNRSKKAQKWNAVETAQVMQVVHTTKIINTVLQQRQMKKLKSISARQEREVPKVYLGTFNQLVKSNVVSKGKKMETTNVAGAAVGILSHFYSLARTEACVWIARFHDHSKKEGSKTHTETQSGETGKRWVPNLIKRLGGPHDVAVLWGLKPGSAIPKEADVLKATKSEFTKINNYATFFNLLVWVSLSSYFQ